jgi:hypothetical protein
MAEYIGALMDWNFGKECPFPKGVEKILVEGEKPIRAYRTTRDVAIFTDKRLIVRDAQGLTGKVVEMYSLPYSEICMWSSEPAGLLKSNFSMWTPIGHIKIYVGKGGNPREIDMLIANIKIGGGAPASVSEGA